MTSPLEQRPRIPKPLVLDPQRVDRDDREDVSAEDHRSRAQLLGKALDESCAYADQLWQTVAALSDYLHANTPADAHDDHAWSTWQDVYASTASILCGPAGDSGFGFDQARAIAQSRRADS